MSGLKVRIDELDSLELASLPRKLSTERKTAPNEMTRTSGKTSSDENHLQQLRQEC